MFEFSHEIKIQIDGIPLQWIPKIELYYPDLPQFPIIYINSYLEDTHVIACPVAVSYAIHNDSCDADFTVLVNVEPDEDISEFVKQELAERIGFSHKISLMDITECCNGATDYETFFIELWNYIKSSYGDYVPYGKYYEEIFSIVRFVSAWQPKTGRQSEMRMLYNFMSAFGEQVQMPAKWNHLEFYIIPNLKDVEGRNLTNYPRFACLDGVMKKLFDKFFTNSVNVESLNFKAMNRAWKQNKDEFISNVTYPMYSEGICTENEKLSAEKLVDAFNRHSWRAAYFISAYMNIDKGYAAWNKSFFIEFYKNGSKLKGYSEKVIACFLQQSFLNPETIPIDTWIETFYRFPLGIQNNDDFFNAFSGLGKLERVIWLASQSNKTNMKAFFDILWCQRYGIIGNRELRGINPIACYSCQLKNCCVGASSMSTTLVKLTENSNVHLNNFYEDGNSSTYVCVLEDGVPKKVYIKRNGNPVLIDEFSGYILTSNHRLSSELLEREVITFREFIFSGESE